MPFLQSTLRVSSGDGHNFVLLEPLDYSAVNGTRYRAITGTSTDGLSTPRSVWNVIPPFGRGWFAGIIHDAAYRGSLVQIIDGKEVTVALSKGDRDTLLNEALQSQGVPDGERLTIYEAVRYGGEHAFESDLAMPLPKVSGDL